MKPELPAFIIGGIALVCGVVLGALHQTVPPEVWIIASGGIGGGLGITVPGRTLQADVENVVRSVLAELEGKPATRATTTVTTTTAPAAPPAPAPAAPAALTPVVAQ